VAVRISFANLVGPAELYTGSLATSYVKATASRIMDRFKWGFLLLLLTLLCSLLGEACGGSTSNANKISPPLALPSPSLGGRLGDANANAESPPRPTRAASVPNENPCKSDNESGTRQVCVFTLEGYKEADYFYDEGAFDAYVRRIAGYIEETISANECHLLSVEVSGYADNLRLNKILPWPDVPSYCSSPQTCRQISSGPPNLTNDDLACVRGCLVTHRIYSLLEQDINILSEKWNDRHQFFTRPSEVGEPYRKVVVILERGGQCPNG
jgi:hypothetical protein